MPVSNEVEAAARALFNEEMKRADHTQTVLEQAAGKALPGARERETFEDHAETVWYPAAMAALEAAAGRPE